MVNGRPLHTSRCTQTVFLVVSAVLKYLTTMYSYEVPGHVPKVAMFFKVCDPLQKFNSHLTLYFPLFPPQTFERGCKEVWPYHDFFAPTTTWWGGLMGGYLFISHSSVILWFPRSSIGAEKSNFSLDGIVSKVFWMSPSSVNHSPRWKSTDSDFSELETIGLFIYHSRVTEFCGFQVWNQCIKVNSALPNKVQMKGSY